MPFKSKSQAKACWAIKRSNPKSKWNCEEWAKKTNYSKLAERLSKKAKSKRQSKRQRSKRR